MIWLAYAAMCLIWGTTWLVIKIGLNYVPPVTGVGLRFLVAGLVLYVVALARRDVPAPRAVPWKVVLALATLLFGFNYVVVYVAETRLESGLVAVLFGTAPFFVFAFGKLIAGERANAGVWAGAAVAFGGVAMICLGGQLRASPIYAFAVIAGAAAAAFANLYAKRHAEYGPLVTLPPSMTLAGVVLSAYGLATERVDWTLAIAPPSLGAIAYLALIGSGFAFFLNFWVLQRVPAWVVGLMPLILPLVAVTAGVAFGGEHFAPREALGSAAVIVGVAIALVQQRKTRTSERLTPSIRTA